MNHEELTDEKLDSMLKEIAKEDDVDLSPEFYKTEMERIIARKKELENEANENQDERLEEDSSEIGPRR